MALHRGHPRDRKARAHLTPNPQKLLRGHKNIFDGGRDRRDDYRETAALGLARSVHNEWAAN
jgi:hypothetical protein